MNLVPTKFFLTKGVGIHEKEMRAFEEALREAGIETCNLVKISSVIPPGCKCISREEGLPLLKEGQITFAVLAQSQTNEPDQIVSAGIGIAQPEDDRFHGYLTELEEVIGITEEDVKEDVEEMALENLASKWGIKKDGEKLMKPRTKNYELKGRKVKLDSMIQTAKGNEDRFYTVVLVAAIMLFD
jgi:arginine decarboxylase